MPVYRPRAIARLVVPNVGTIAERTQQEALDNVTTLQVRVNRVAIESNSHNEADECEIQASYDDAGMDPRFLRAAEVYVHLGDGDDKGYFQATEDNLRFIGIANSVERVFNAEGGKQLAIKAQDYTCLFLACKHFPPKGYPDFSMTLEDAWARICQYTGLIDLQTKTIVSTVSRLARNISFIPEDLRSVTIGKSLAPRIAKEGKLHAHGTNPDAWTVWQTIVGSLGLISYMRNDRCIVTTMRDFYSGDDPPRFVYGKNILKISERRDVHTLSGKNVHIMSFNPLTMQTVESFFPPLSFVAPTGKGAKKKMLAASALGAPLDVKAQNYETFMCPMPITDQSVLDQFAERVWHERVRQELRGDITTREMFMDTVDQKRFDLLKLQAGDRIRVEIDQGALTLIQREPTIQRRAQLLQDRGYSSQMAMYLAKNLDGITKVVPEFQVHRVRTVLDVVNPDSGSFNLDVEFINRIDVSGSAQPGDGTGSAPVTNQKDDTSADETRRNGRDAKGGP